jgi:transcriptional regulator with XRE-family HTH domain
MSNFGTQIRRLRKERGWSLNILAKKLGTQKGYLSGIENGKVNPPSVKLLKRFAKVFEQDEKAMLRMAWADKAPELIREDTLRIMAMADLEQPVPGPMVSIRLLNPGGAPYPVESGPEGVLVAAGAHRLILPRGEVPPDGAIVVLDDSMARADGTGYRKGDIVLLASLPSLPSSGPCFLVVRGADGTARALIRHVSSESRNQVVLQPWNSEHPLEFLSPDDVKAACKVIGRIEIYTQEKSA